MFSLIGIVTIVSSLHKANDDVFKHLYYIEDVIYDLKWRWSWVDNQITNLWCFCPKCDAELVYDDSVCFNPALNHFTDFNCENCRKRVGRVPGGNKDFTLGKISREIDRRIRTGEFRKALYEAGKGVTLKENGVKNGVSP